MSLADVDISFLLLFIKKILAGSVLLVKLHPFWQYLRLDESAGLKKSNKNYAKVIKIISKSTHVISDKGD